MLPELSSRRLAQKLECNLDSSCGLAHIDLFPFRFALRERRVHVTQEDFEMAVAKVTSRLFIMCIG